MKTVILAGGMGTRLAEETDIRPKPMIEIGGRPMLWHIMHHYAHFGHNHFAIALGYKGDYIKKYVVDYCSLNSDLTVKLGSGDVQRHGNGNGNSSDWTIDLIDTGITSTTGGRLRRLAAHLGNSTFMMTYGDGVSNVDLDALLAFHRKHGKLATVTAVRPPARFGHMVLNGDEIVEFSEKPQTGEGWINGGFFVFEPGVLEYIDGAGDGQWLEREPMEKLASDKQLVAYRHPSFWQCMDTLRDKRMLEELWDRGNAPWAFKGEKHARTGNGTSGLHRDGAGADAAGRKA